MTEGPWTHFWDMHSGGGRKLDWDHVFIEAPEGEARKLFAEAFGRNPDNETCNCCGGDYSITEEHSLAELTGHHRHLRFATPYSRDEWLSTPPGERRNLGDGRYLEPGEPVPAGWSVDYTSAVAERHTPMPFADFLADPHFDDFGRRREVKIVRRPRA